MLLNRAVVVAIPVALVDPSRERIGWTGPHEEILVIVEIIGNPAWIAIPKQFG